MEGATNKYIGRMNLIKLTQERDSYWTVMNTLMSLWVRQAIHHITQQIPESFSGLCGKMI
jgi:hypothetical protein